jgi:peptidyl-prolyl cis-trans isomerase B (cyclophilin B)
LRYRFNLVAMVLMLMGTGLIFSGCNPASPIEAETDFFQYGTAVLETEAGEIVIRLEKEKAPESAKNFLNLCGTGFYNGTYFHRVVPGLLVQGGDPNTLDNNVTNDGMGGYSYLGPGTFLPDELNDLKNERGTIAMVRGDEPGTVGSQFFILLDDVPEYDGKYTVFGRVESGMDILVEIAEQPGSVLEEGGFRLEKPLIITGSSVR